MPASVERLVAHLHAVEAELARDVEEQQQYWCPIKHAHVPAAPHGRYHRFFDYGDAERYHGDLGALRGTLRPGEPDSPDGGKGGGHAHHNQ